MLLLLAAVSEAQSDYADNDCSALNKECHYNEDCCDNLSCNYSLDYDKFFCEKRDNYCLALNKECEYDEDCCDNLRCNYSEEENNYFCGKNENMGGSGYYF